MQRTLEAMRLEAQIAKDMETYQKRPKRRFVGARAEEYRFARYVEDWRLKIERIGNLNYPEAAREQKLYGSLLLTVSIKSDGSVENIEVNRTFRQPHPRRRGDQDRRDVGALRAVPARHQARHRHPPRHAHVDVHQGGRAGLPVAQLSGAGSRHEVHCCLYRQPSVPHARLTAASTPSSSSSPWTSTPSSAIPSPTPNRRRSTRRLRGRRGRT